MSKPPHLLSDSFCSISQQTTDGPYLQMEFSSYGCKYFKKQNNLKVGVGAKKKRFISEPFLVLITQR